MNKFVIQPHFRLQEWVADEKGYFAAEGLDYVFHEEVQATDGKVHDKGQKIGAYQSFDGRTFNGLAGILPDGTSLLDCVDGFHLFPHIGLSTLESTLTRDSGRFLASSHFTH